MKRIVLLITTLAIASSLSLTGCSKDNQQPDKAAPATEKSAPATEKPAPATEKSAPATEKSAPAPKKNSP